MVFDMVPLFPFTLIFSHKYSRLYFLIKCIRIKKCYHLLDTKKFNKIVKDQYDKRLNENCKDENIANDMMIDHTQINVLLNIQNGFKTYRLVMIIFGISYFIGIMFYIYADLVNDIPTFLPPGQERNTENFIEYYLLEEMNSFKKAIALVYYAFTSLSTVGFGDYNPRSDAERVLIAVVLLFGVLTFSYAMGNFIQILD
jgi:hypothetical protein